MRWVIALSLVAATVTIHATGLGMAFSRFLHQKEWPKTDFVTITRFMIRIAIFLVILHSIEIAVWALFYWWQKCMPDAESAFYFSGVTYVSIGYGDLLLTKEWRLLGPVEGLTGILMCGLSTGFFFAVMNAMYGARSAARRP